MRKALVVGFNNYKGCELHGCINDAHKIAALLEKNENGSPNFEVKLITDENKQITQGELRGHITDLFSGTCDMAVLYFSGHGTISSSGGSIVTPDFTKHNLGIGMNEILNLANASNLRDKVIILDCCHSGDFGNPLGESSDLCMLTDGVTILTASKKDESSVEVNGAGIFTTLLVDALNGGAADLIGHVTSGKIYSYIDEALGAWNQRPVFKTNVSRFSSIREAKPPINVNILRNLTKYFHSITDLYILDPTYEFTSPSKNDDNVVIFKELQKLVAVGVIVPVDEEHMYFAAMNSKACKLTSIGYHYWKLAKEGKI
ncbi:caspase family protein [Clostridium akagii]|uniref:caspase family protein n=1 Tax=Clostridium akagii TaxID=91623 RepID=UPI0004786976|nr:caspase family protein [Clostridium akagii]